ncbi:Thioredoxin-dependent peroxide reductase, mitochondrial [Myotis davidii]|uniref:thioredoxin-dependent peroxiredoxin n=1 Tax=Myotis davidii TaxID=225400 RepID=L5M4T6_MYODS|nr:Thioredoxin-dependent peroxide reductase, mitochondrial [Myotis davidii]
MDVPRHGCRHIGLSGSPETAVLREGPGLALRGLFVMDPNGVSKHIGLSGSPETAVLREGPGLALRGLFVMDPNGVSKHVSVSDLPMGRSVGETLCLVKASQFVEVPGEVCPAN